MSCHFIHLLQVQKKCLSLKSDFIHLGQTAPRGQHFDVSRKALSLYLFVASFKEISLSLILYILFHDLIHVYSPREGGIQPPRDKVLMSTEISCHFGHLLLVSTLRRQQFLKNPMFYLFPPYKSLKDQI